MLEENGICVMLNISTDIRYYYVDENSIEYRQIHCLDTCMQNILEHMDEIFDFLKKRIDGEKKNAFVHCYWLSDEVSFKNIQRSSYQLVRMKRQIINLNLNFLNQLQRYEQILNV